MKLGEDKLLRIEFKPNPTQDAFIRSRATADYFSCRVGEGKSTALNWSAFYHTRQNPGCTALMVRDTWENLRRTTLATFFDSFPPGIFGSWHETNKEWTWAEGIAKGKIIWLGMDSADDASKLQSLVAGWIGMDEVAPATDSGGIPETIFDLGLTRLRQPEMHWYGMKLASNNSDDTHWGYRRFVDPGAEGFKLWQPAFAENMKNLPPGYYEKLRSSLSHRPDLIARFVEGSFGFQQIGQAVTPQFNEKIHLANGLIPVRGHELVLLWDFGLNPTCIISQISPLGHWNILRSFVGEGIGATELIEDVVKPILKQRYDGFRWRHIGDPNGNTREQSSSKSTAVSVIRRELGGSFRGGSVSAWEGIECLRAVLSRMINGRGLVQIDRVGARHVWLALRGGWHYAERNSGVLSPEAVKDSHSHPGDAMRYGASRLYPVGVALRSARLGAIPRPTFFGNGTTISTPFRVPPEMRRILENVPDGSSI
jgi:hypothetical protein